MIHFYILFVLSNLHTYTMGVLNLLPFLREKCPDAFRDIPYSHFKGKRVAVDSDNVLRKLMSRSHKEIVNQTDVCSKEPDRKKIVETWLFHIKEEILKYLSHGINLVFVFDGSYIDEKSNTQQKRRADKAKRVQEAEDLKQKIMEIDELERTPAMVTELRKKMHHLGTIKPEDKALIITVFQALGIPVLFAKEEGEKLCAMLCIEGKVSAVYSRDSDLLAMGCPLFFSEEAGWVYNNQSKRTEQSLKSVVFQPILASLDMEYSTFLDLCIMAGCDFNSNIYRVGIATSFKLLKSCQKIENLPDKYKDKIEILNHERCREIFQRQQSADICLSSEDTLLDVQKLDINRNIDVAKLKELGLSDWAEEFQSLYKDLPYSSDMVIERPPSLKSSKIVLKIINGTDDKKTNQKASPPKMTSKMVSDLASQQVANYKLKILS